MAQLERLKQEIARDLRAMANIVAPGEVGSARSIPSGDGKAPVARKRPKMSAAARKKISEAQKKRWAKQKSGK
jgi:hypothetical protein